MKDQRLLKLLSTQAALTRWEEEVRALQDDAVEVPPKYEEYYQELKASVLSLGQEYGMTEHDFSIVQFLAYRNGTLESHFGIPG
jgi:hypothetical protein